jgi:hypothetical protein
VRAPKKPLALARIASTAPHEVAASTCSPRLGRPAPALFREGRPAIPAWRPPHRPSRPPHPRGRRGPPGGLERPFALEPPAAADRPAAAGAGGGAACPPASTTPPSRQRRAPPQDFRFAQPLLPSPTDARSSSTSTRIALRVSAGPTVPRFVSPVLRIPLFARRFLPTSRGRLPVPW